VTTAASVRAATRLVVGIDPSLTATGVAVLEWPGAGMRLLHRETIRTAPAAPLIERLETIRDGLILALLRARALAGEEWLEMAVEDPTDFRAPKSGPSQMLLFGTAIGVAMITASHIGEQHAIPVRCYKLGEWLPKARGTRGGGWIHPEKHKTVIERHRALVPGLREASDDEVMAAALALHHFAVLRSVR
jgi:Holliday junction resolvasome RuvABC endonuclease subunit